jgi:truncated hemoglobin YjbI
MAERDDEQEIPGGGGDAREARRARTRRGPLAPNPRMWAWLAHGAKLRAILLDFYGEVYADPRLSPFFHATTIEWAIDHQYAFLGEIFSGEPMFFGDRPRNAHHWMVIDDALFDYREALMERCLQRHGLPDDLIVAWRAVEEVFRSHIVKAKPIVRMRNGMPMPLEGYERLALEAGGMCDGCEAVIERGGDSWYHVRTGKAFCEPCAGARGAGRDGVEGVSR